RTRNPPHKSAFFVSWSHFRESGNPAFPADLGAWEKVTKFTRSYAFRSGRVKVTIPALRRRARSAGIRRKAECALRCAFFKSHAFSHSRKIPIIQANLSHR